MNSLISLENLNHTGNTKKRLVGHLIIMKYKVATFWQTEVRSHNEAGRWIQESELITQIHCTRRIEFLTTREIALYFIIKQKRETGLEIFIILK